MTQARPNTFTANTTILSSEVNEDLDTLYDTLGLKDYDAEHNAAGTHKAITATSITTTGAAQFGGAFTASSTALFKGAITASSTALFKGVITSSANNVWRGTQTHYNDILTATNNQHNVGSTANKFAGGFFTTINEGPTRFKYDTATSVNYTFTDTDSVGILDHTTGNSNRTAQLPTASANTGHRITINKADTGTGYVSINNDGSGEIFRLTDQYDSITYLSNGTTWVKISTAHATKVAYHYEDPNGYGSVGTNIRKYTTTVNANGLSLTAANSNANGLSFTVNQKGKYCVYRRDTLTGAAGRWGVSINASSLTTAIESLADDERLLVSDQGSGEISGDTLTLELDIGDVIRPQDASTENVTDYRGAFKIERIDF